MDAELSQALGNYAGLVGLVSALIMTIGAMYTKAKPHRSTLELYLVLTASSIFGTLLYAGATDTLVLGVQPLTQLGLVAFIALRIAMGVYGQAVESEETRNLHKQVQYATGNDEVVQPHVEG